MHFSAGRVVGKVGVEPPIPAVSASPDIGMVGVEPSNLQLTPRHDFSNDLCLGCKQIGNEVI